ncbi:tetratricopeptide repeat protein [Parageobacillus galactosidasius]|uniref:tetratricopeptide repeat protein n=1 Tax=Parageobacillus galactosidasius TaxID=883812 RepID=UPI001FE4228D|nr:tetratricopeptide repeat protein [Parageobacillus galactosidasius]
MLQPQPIGVFPGAAGFFLLPPVPEADQFIPLLLRGHLPDSWPESWLFFAAAIEGKSEDEVLTLLPEGPEAAYNRFILDPQTHTYTLAKEVLSGDFSLLLDAVAWRLKLCETPPPLGDTTGEIRAFLLAIQAYDAFQRKDWPTGLSLLLEAAATVEDVSPVFSARLHAEWAATKQMLGDHGKETIEGYRKALALLETSSFQESKAELWFQLGSVYQTGAEGRKSSLLEAVRCYHEALKVYRKDTYPEEYATIHMNLALVYLAMPSLDRSAYLRTATAIQSLRETLRIFKKDTHPELWASATVNLANALQHVKTSHLEENLWEAVALYEEVLEVRRLKDDPIGCARVLANQGNALAHLGAFSRAVPRLEEASRLFRTYGEHEAANAIEDILAEIACKRKEAVPMSKLEAEIRKSAMDRREEV